MHDCCSEGHGHTTKYRRDIVIELVYTKRFLKTLTIRISPSSLKNGDSAWPHHLACFIWQYVSLSYS